MKKILFILFAAVTISCNNNTTHHNHHSTTSAPPDTTDKSMYALMQKNMADMMKVKSSGDPDKDFASLMIIHHQGAVDMAQQYLKEGKDQELRNFAESIIRAQETEIGLFNTFLTSATTSTTGNTKFYDEAMDEMHDMELKPDDKASVEVQFIKMMIPHHQGAIEMSRTYLTAGSKDEKLRGMAAKIIEDQRKEIVLMQDWLDKHQK